MTRNFISIQLVLSKIFLILLLLTSFLSLISDPGLNYTEPANVDSSLREEGVMTV